MGQNMLVGTCIPLSPILIFVQPHKSQKHSMTFSFFLRFPEILLYSKIIPHTSIVRKRVKCFSLMMKLSKLLPLHSFVHIIGFQVMQVTQSCYENTPFSKMMLRISGHCSFDDKRKYKKYRPGNMNYNRIFPVRSRALLPN